MGQERSLAGLADGEKGVWKKKKENEKRGMTMTTTAGRKPMEEPISTLLKKLKRSPVRIFTDVI